MSSYVSSTSSAALTEQSADMGFAEAGTANGRYDSRFQSLHD